MENNYEISEKTVLAFIMEDEQIYVDYAKRLSFYLLYFLLFLLLSVIRIMAIYNCFIYRPSICQSILA